MSVTIRGNKFHYRFLLRGKGYSGVCPGCEIPQNATARDIEAIRKLALKYEADLRAKVTRESREREVLEADIRKNRTVKALVENYKYELTGGTPITLSEAYAMAAHKPAKRNASEKSREQKSNYYKDFVAFMAGSYPDITDLAGVRRAHCEAYVKYLTDYGRYVKEVAYTLPGKRKKDVAYTRDYALSPKTVKEIIGACKWVFSRLEEDAGIIHNPWLNVVLPKIEQTDREIFTEAELAKIRDGIQADDFCRPLFLIAAVTGLTEGDICTLKWDEIDWQAHVVYHTRRKTGVKMTIPLLGSLEEYFHTLPHQGEYVLPDHAEMYLRQPSCVSYRVKKFLDGIGIDTVRKVEGRRAISVKDLHSMRHVFCYYAGQSGIPLATVQSIVGHMTPEMTRHYMSHVSIEAKHQAVEKLPGFLCLNSGEPVESDNGATLRQRLSELAYSLPIEQVRRILSDCAPRLPCA